MMVKFSIPEKITRTTCGLERTLLLKLILEDCHMINHNKQNSFSNDSMSQATVSAHPNSTQFLEDISFISISSPGYPWMSNGTTL